MAPTDFDDPRLAKALQREKELQDQIKAATDVIKAAMQELEKWKQFREMYRSLSPEAEGEKVPAPVAEPPPALHRRLKGTAYGNVQAVFQSLAIDILRDVGRPMNSSEFIEEFRKRGQPLGGHEIRTAWNRLWQARKAGALVHFPGLGYWITGEALSEEAKEQARIAAKRTRSHSTPRASVKEAKGKPKGPPRAMTPEQVATAERMLLTGRTLKEVAGLFGVAIGTLTNYTGDLNEVIARHPGVVVPKRSYAGRSRGPGTWGRKPKLSPEQEQQVVHLRAVGMHPVQIATQMGVKRTTIYKILKKAAEPKA